MGSICHGSWFLVETGMVAGHALASWPSLQTGIHDAGGTRVDEEVHIEKGAGTSRRPDDMPTFYLSRDHSGRCESKHTTKVRRAG
ncbi:DJ-1/PfpI family protein [Ktedonobacter racemifer]|uniref:DJ-1/PfpI family protein n=1 Tax=Ktedonobacter racemifer TaxID=363277 RepID=UPI003B75CB1B